METEKVNRMLDKLKKPQYDYSPKLK